MEVTDPKDTQDRFLEAVSSDEIPNIYFNTFMNGLGISDISVVLERNGSSVAILNMSYTTAKSFSLKLGQLLADFEALTGRQMLTADEILKALSRDEKATSDE